MRIELQRLQHDLREVLAASHRAQADADRARASAAEAWQLLKLLRGTPYRVHEG